MATKIKFSKSVVAGTPIPKQLIPTLTGLMQSAESAFPAGSGVDKKAWVKARAIELAKSFDLKAIPNWLENPAKEIVVGLVIEVLFQLGAHQTFPAIAEA